MRAIFKRENSALSLPIVQAARTYAQQFAQQQNSPEKSQQVRLNTLAVWVVRDYLQMMDIPTDLVNSQSWNSMMRMIADIADLELPGIGCLECRPVQSQQTECYVPPETWENRVGYVIVEIDDAQLTAKILGFVPQVKDEYLCLNQILPIEDLFEHLELLKVARLGIVTNLSQWFHGIFEIGWQTWENLWNQPDLLTNLGFRNSGISAEQRKSLSITQRAKLINLGTNIIPINLVLVVEICPQSGERTHIQIQLYSISRVLPSGLKLAVLDDCETIFLEVEVESSKNQMQLQFNGEAGEHFSLKIELNNYQITEKFVI
ncbi:DUF1822 family protein [Calothrix sp. PCC 6303]|uniref:DUF1822 family protein n=1 Tax=Calothrix sp. PCC 6303 TaxID=1170562 RepID=UPI0002A03551|nr:DUF1822 family protein [Calothrix sp. PCC 6303]AFZ02446.1 protein of unknown function DUF1822 [Calothrix sp. PCC 6303]